MILLILLAAVAPPPVQFHQRLGEALPLDSVWRDESGRKVPLANALAPKQPAVVVFGYYNCPELCSIVQQGTVDSLRRLGPSVGRDFTLIDLSIDPTDTPEAARVQRAAAARAYGRGDSLAGWHYLTGTAPEIRRVAAAAGFDFRYDAPTRQFAHPAGFLIVTPRGVISRYFLGVDFNAGEVATALRAAGRGDVGPSVFNLILQCFRGGPDASPRERLIWDGLWSAVLLTVLALGGGIGWMLLDERRTRRTA